MYVSIGYPNFFTTSRLFPVLEPRVVNVEARQFPVTVHFEKRTPENYMIAAFRKVKLLFFFFLKFCSYSLLPSLGLSCVTAFATFSLHVFTQSSPFCLSFILLTFFSLVMVIIFVFFLFSLSIEKVIYSTYTGPMKLSIVLITGQIQ